MTGNWKLEKKETANRPAPYVVPTKKEDETPFGNPKLFWKVRIPFLLYIIQTRLYIACSSKIWSHQLSMR